MPNPLAIDRALMLRLADLARLHLPAEKLPLLRERLERIVAAFQSLQEADGEPVPPAAAALPSPLRPDVAVAPLTPDEVLANACATGRAGDHFVVPRVVDG